MNRTIIAAAALLALATPLAAAPAAPPPAPAAKSWPVAEGDFTIADFAFASGEKLPQLRQHYRTLGTPHRGPDGQIDNAVMVLHGTGGSGAQFLRPQFADELYGPGQPLDITKYFIILPDAIGHGNSSKPSDGARMAFPRYDYADMVNAQYRLLTEHFGIKRLRLLMGTSMGCMLDFVWGTTHPGFARAIMPTACLPVEIAGRNRLWRVLSINAIKGDPAWQGGNYTAQPLEGMTAAGVLTIIAGSAPVAMQAQYPTRAAADAAAPKLLADALAGRDANDWIYQLDASRSYNPAPLLGRITVPVTWINSADDFINPPGLDIAAGEAKKMPNARFILLPESVDGRGHSTHTWAKFWKADLIDLLKRSQ